MSNTNGDIYPGRVIFQEILTRLQKSVENNQIELPAINQTVSREELVTMLLDSHNTKKFEDQPITNSDFLGSSFTDSTLLDALTSSVGYTSIQQWSNWAGNYEGSFYSVTNKFTDRARWMTPINKQTDLPNQDIDNTNAQLRIYFYQDVDFLDGTTVVRRGFNEAHPDFPYLLGWDPKNQGNQNGEIGTHIGFSFTRNNMNYIIWLTPQEAYFEVISPGDSPDSNRKRTADGCRSNR